MLLKKNSEDKEGNHVIIANYLNIEKNFKGIRFLIGSGFAFSLMTVCVKAIGGRIPISELVFARATISIIITRFFLYKNNYKNNIKTKNHNFLIHILPY